MTEDFEADVASVGQIEAVPTILEVVCRTTGIGFAAVVRVTERNGVACEVLDEIDFGLKPGGELKPRSSWPTVLPSALYVLSIHVRPT